MRASAASARRARGTDSTRRARLRALAKINLTLEVLHKRADGYHEIRTIFQTVSLADTIELEFNPARRARITIASSPEIPGNLAALAAEAVLDAARARGEVRITLRKRIPMGAGLGGGSSDAAAILLALPVLAGCVIESTRLHELAAALGSDVPFFLTGGAALGLGRGAEVYPLPEAAAGPALIVAPGIHVSTAEAYSALNRSLTSSAPSPTMKVSRLLALCLGGELRAGDWPDQPGNDFESVVFERHPELRRFRDRLRRLGARPAMMTGSGASLFGIFPDREARERARRAFADERVFPVTLVGRRRYHTLWWNQLRDHINQLRWPPQSRYAR